MNIEMNAGGTDRPRMTLGSSKSFCNGKTMPAVKGVANASGNGRTLFKAPQKPSADEQNASNQCRTIPRIVKTGVRETARISKAHAVHKKQINIKFVRPSVDMMAARKRMIERNIRMGELLVENVPKKNTDYKNKIIMEKLYLGHTPKQSALSKVYQKLDESIKKSAQSTKTICASPLSPFEELHMPTKKNRNTIQRIYNNNNRSNNNNNNNNNNNDDDDDNDVLKCSEAKTESKIIGLIGCNNAIGKVEKMETSKSPVGSILYSSKDASGFTEGKSNDQLEIKLFENNKKCALTNILKHCQVYSIKMSEVTDEIICLDESFKRVIIAEVGGQLYSKFCEYQKKKIDLQKEIRAIEEELEEAVTRELDVKRKFQEYLSKKSSKWKEESDLLEEFKNSVNNLIDKCEEELTRPEENKSLKEIVDMLMSSTSMRKDVENVENRGFPLRRSKRLLAVTKTPDNNAVNSRILRSSCVRNLRGENSDVKENSRKT